MKKINLIPLYSLVRREVKRFLNVIVQTVFNPLISTGLYFIIFSYSFKGREVAGYGIPYIKFIVPGLIMMSVIQNSFANTSSSLIVAKYEGNIIDFFLAPFSHVELALGFMVGGVMRGMVVGTVIYLVSIFFAGAEIAHPLLAIISMLLVSAVFALLGVLGGLWAKTFDHVSIFSNFFITPLTFLSGVFYSVKNLPGIWSKVSMINPVYYMVDLTRYAFVGQSDVNPFYSVYSMIMVFCSLLYLVTYLLKKGYNIKS